jgi:hypothetical protein
MPTIYDQSPSPVRERGFLILEVGITNEDRRSEINARHRQVIFPARMAMSSEWRNDSMMEPLSRKGEGLFDFRGGHYQRGPKVRD